MYRKFQDKFFPARPSAAIGQTRGAHGFECAKFGHGTTRRAKCCYYALRTATPGSHSIRVLKPCLPKRSSKAKEPYPRSGFNPPRTLQARARGSAGANAPTTTWQGPFEVEVGNRCRKPREVSVPRSSCSPVPLERPSLSPFAPPWRGPTASRPAPGPPQSGLVPIGPGSSILP